VPKVHRFVPGQGVGYSTGLVAAVASSWFA
jgi:hypothetical protein